MNIETKPGGDQRSLKETLHLLRSPRNAERLLSAINRARTEEIAPSNIEELEKLCDLKD